MDNLQAKLELFPILEMVRWLLTSYEEESWIGFMRQFPEASLPDYERAVTLALNFRELRR